MYFLNLSGISGSSEIMCRQAVRERLKFVFFLMDPPKNIFLSGWGWVDYGCVLIFSCLTKEGPHKCDETTDTAVRLNASPANVMRTSQFSVGTVFIQDLWDMMCLPACSSRFPNNLSEEGGRSGGGAHRGAGGRETNMEGGRERKTERVTFSK